MNCLACSRRLLAIRRIELGKWESIATAERADQGQVSGTTRVEVQYAWRLYRMAEIRAAKFRELAR